MTITIAAGLSTYTLNSGGVTATLPSGVRGSTNVSSGIYDLGSNDVLLISGTVVAGEQGGPNSAILVSGGTGDSVTIMPGAYVHGAQADSDGVYFVNTEGTIDNAGTIGAGGGGLGNQAVGVNLSDGGSLTNASTGTILQSVYVAFAAGTVTNSGKISGDSVYGAVYMKQGGMVTNLAGTIAANGAAYGISITGGGTVANAGTITGGSAAGSAVLLASGYTNRVIVDPGGAFIGTVNGGTPALSTLELAAGGSGTVTGFDSQYVNFGTLAFDPTSNWVVKATTGISSAVIDGMGAGETIDLTGFTATHSTTVSSTDFVVTNAGGTSVALHFGTPLTSFTFSTGAFGTDVNGLCFCAGTGIATPAGETLVEHLKHGDLVLTSHGETRRVTWIGEGRVLATRGKRSAATPVIVAAGALAAGVPYRDLRVTKGHALYLDDVLIPVEFLVNHRTIRWDDHAQEVHVLHVELAAHDVLVANGAPAESYRDDGNRWLFRNSNPRWGLPVEAPYAPILTGGAVVDALWRRLLDNAGPRALPPMTDDDDLHLIMDGACVEPSGRDGGTVLFRLPRVPTAVRLGSRSMAPDALGLARDPRCLGVAVRGIEVRQGNATLTIRAHDRRLTEGFHDYEAAGDLRWTNGDAALPVDLFPAFVGALEVEVRLGATTRYPVLEDRKTREVIG